jgi:signal transduction histidine kinase
MTDFFRRLFSDDFMPHGHCYFWKPEIVWLHVVSDTLITLAYYSIPVILLVLVRKRRDLPFHWMFVMFGAFILGCGTTHLMEIWTLWHSTYRLSGLVKLATAILSVGTAVALVPVVPKALAIPTINERLRAEVEERKRAQAEIARLYGQAQAAVRVRETFLSVAGHELRTPLNALLLQTQTLIRKSPPDSDAVRLSHKIEQQAHRLARLTDRLLDVTRLSDEGMRLDPEEMDLSALAREVVERMNGEDRGGTIRLDAPAGAHGSWDRLRLEQVVTNLLENAVKFGDRKPVDVEVRAHDSEVTLAVRDRGIGIAEPDQARIFERFERAVSEKHYAGMGLGLWICRRIVEAHGGTIALESRPGEGTVFRIALPRVAPASGEAAKFA